MSDLAPTYRRYNEACNAHRFDDLPEFVHDELVVNGGRISRAADDVQVLQQLRAP
jgi:hypothetical protein